MVPSQWTRLRSALDVSRRFETMQRRMAPGSLGGRTDTASPVSPSAKGVAVPKTVEAAGAGVSSLLIAIGGASTQSFANGVSERVEFDTELQRAGASDATPGANPGSWALTPGGFYVISASVTFDISGTGYRDVSINNFGVTSYTTADAIPRLRVNNAVALNFTYVGGLSFGCYVPADAELSEVWVDAEHSAGAPLNVVFDTYSFLSILRVA